MGNCCAANSETGNIQVIKGGNSKSNADVISSVLDNREIAGYRGKDKMILLIKI